MYIKTCGKCDLCLEYGNVCRHGVEWYPDEELETTDEIRERIKRESVVNKIKISASLNEAVNKQFKDK